MPAYFELLLDGPGKNSLSTAMMESILRRLDEAGDAPLLVSGKGDALSAGLNLKEIAALDAPGMERFVRLVDEVMARLFEHPAPTVACVNGHAIAGGCVLLLCCDYRVSTDAPGARIGLNEVALGLVFPPKILRVVTHRVPPRSRYEVVLRSALYPPADALRLGLVDELAADARERAVARIEELSALPRAAYLASKRALHAGVTAYEGAAYEEALRATFPAWTSDEIKQRVLAKLRR
jgi:enoyl-CoA hydratase